MSRGFFAIFKQPKPKTIIEGTELINEILEKIGESIQYIQLRYLIKIRKNAFLVHIESSGLNKQAFIEAYVHFASNLKDYLDSGGDIDERISLYHGSRHYYHVGGSDNKWSYSFADNLADYLLKLSIVALVIAAVVTPFNLTVGLTALGLALTLMGPSMMYTIAVTKHNASKIKKEEIELYREAQKLVDPDAANIKFEEEKPKTSFQSCC
ncbi:MAG: hypothetical protein H0U70_04485 [Tatlockia sp.]|nr:hypothetical protein [Tatlockia sp.]